MPPPSLPLHPCSACGDVACGELCAAAARGRASRSPRRPRLQRGEAPAPSSAAPALRPGGAHRPELARRRAAAAHTAWRGRAASAGTPPPPSSHSGRAHPSSSLLGSGRGHRDHHNPPPPLPPPSPARCAGERARPREPAAAAAGEQRRRRPPRAPPGSMAGGAASAGGHGEAGRGCWERPREGLGGPARVSLPRRSYNAGFAARELALDGREWDSTHRCSDFLR